MLSKRLTVQSLGHTQGAVGPTLGRILGATVIAQNKYSNAVFLDSHFTLKEGKKKERKKALGFSDF